VPRRRTDLVARHQVAPGRRFRLSSVDPAARKLSENDGRARLAQAVERIGELQDRLYAQDRWALLVILQGMDASGKDGAIQRVFAEVDPAGCQVFSFKAPSEEELDHDFLWRAARALPERGRIGVFNRSYYEEVVTVRVHREFLERQKLPPRLVGKELWDQRFEDINAFERYLSRNGVLIRKFFLHVSREEQRRRFLARLDQPEKNWKFQLGDVRERARWDEYQRWWSEAIARTSTPYAPWCVAPADSKWYARTVVAETVLAALEELELDFPRVDAARRSELGAARRELVQEEAPRRKKRRRKA
jgi:PPK2 family polyphosphate:nucleotide phosphotransferase